MLVKECLKRGILYKCRFDFLPDFRQRIAICSVDVIGPYSTVKGGSRLREP